MLVSGIILLFSVIVPHHHHDDGSICILVVSEHHHDAEKESEEGGGHKHSCDCSGHNIAFNGKMISNHSTENDLPLLLTPLYTFLEYTCPQELHFLTEALLLERSYYIESLHGNWIPVATGLRAPPARA